MKKPKILKTTFNTFSVSKVLGQGGSGKVYLGEDPDGNAFAIKCLDPQFVSREKLKRFKNEFIFCSKVDHPNIIKVLDHGLTDKSEAFFVMPVFDSSLRPLIETLTTKEALLIFEKLLDGVESAHILGVIHRDLKPENILIKNRGEDLVVADFGIAHFEEDELYTAVETKDSTRLANFQYAAPEQRKRGKEVRQTADIYALGLMLNELFTKEIPQGTNYIQIGDIDPLYSYLDPIVEKMLEQNPMNRFGSIEEIKYELIARGRENIVRQKLSKTKKTVISVNEIDDPIVNEPMKIIGVDWNNNNLTILLNHNVNETWVGAINNMGGYSSVLNKGPKSFRFSGNKAEIYAQSNEVQQIVDYFQQWLPRANQVYEQRLKNDKKTKEIRLREELVQKIKEEEERESVLKNITF